MGCGKNRYSLVKVAPSAGSFSLPRCDESNVKIQWGPSRLGCLFPDGIYESFDGLKWNANHFGAPYFNTVAAVVLESCGLVWASALVVSE